jgi:uncharacterized protein (TIGR00297 family)
VNTLENILVSVPSSDWYISGIAAICISFLLFVVEIGIKYFNLPSIYTRKFIHIATGLIICIVSYFIFSNIPIIIFAAFYIFIDLWALRKGKFKSIHPDSNSFGTLFYAVSVIILALLFWGVTKPLFIITNLIMIIPDAMAALAGERYATRYFIPVYEKKSLIGAFTMFFLTLVLTFVSLVFFYNLSLEKIMMIALIIALIATISELLSFRGSDNLSVPLVSGLFLYTILYSSNPDSLTHIIFGVVASAIIAIVSYKIHFLDRGGSALAFLMGSIIFSLGGWAYTLPILGFFISSSLLSKGGKLKKKQLAATYQKSGIRDFHQTLANGGVATILVLTSFLSGYEMIYYVYIASLAAATADTWGTELGIFSKKNPVLITNFNSVSPGTSGGISIIGSIASLFGSIFIVFIGSLFISLTSYQIIFIVLFGYAGSLMDSIIGATLQGQYKCEICNKNTESKFHCKCKTNLIHGKPYIDNDLVNLFSIFFSALITFLFFFKENI